MTRKIFRNIIWAAAGVLAIICVASHAYHHLATASIIFALGAVQEEEVQ